MRSASGWSASSRGRSRATRRTLPKDCHAVREDAAGERLFDRLVRQVAPDARTTCKARLARSTAGRTLSGFDYFWGFLGGESGQFDPVMIENNSAIGVPDGEGLLPPRRDDRQDDRVAARRARPRLRQAMVRVLLDRLQPRAASGHARMVGPVQGQVRPGLGQAARGDLRAPEAARRHPGRRGADGASRGDARLGLARREP